MAIKPQIGPSWAVSPRQWGARVNYDNWNDRYSPDDGLALHHGGGGNYAAHQKPYSRSKEQAQLRAWERYHLSKGWRGIAYGWAIGQTGTVYRLRGWNGYGAHLGDVDGDGISNNSEIIPILFIGSGSRTRLSPAAQKSLAALRRWIEAQLGRPMYLYGHKEIQPKPTSCPGQYGMEYVKANRWLGTNGPVGDGNGATKKSLFIQVRSYEPTALRTALEHVRAEHKDRSKDDYIYNVVLDEIGSSLGLSPNLDIIADYLPGGSRKCFDNVFVGSHFVPRPGGQHYNVGMTESDHRWDNLKIQKKLWQQFAAKYPHIYINFYINHEGVLDFFDQEDVRRGYEAYLVQSVRDAHAIKPNRAILWAPAVWSAKDLTGAEVSGVSKTFNNVEYWAKKAGHYGGIKWLHFQDMMGRGDSRVELGDVKRWFQQLDAAYDWDSLAIDMELFTKSASGGLVPQSATIIQQREDWYESQGMPVGASWELRWWMQNHKEL